MARIPDLNLLVQETIKLHCFQVHLTQFSFFMGITARSRGGFLYHLFCFVVALAPSFVVDGWRTSPLLLIWAAWVGARWKVGDREVATDCLIFGVMNTYLAREGFKGAMLQLWQNLEGEGRRFLLWRVAIPLALIGILLHVEFRKTTDIIWQELPKGLTKWTLQYPRPMIFPCQTKHARMFPKRHSFEYSYLQCGFPIIPAGVTALGEDVGLGHDRQLGRWWLRIKAEDYLERGNGALGFYGNLKMYLSSQVCVLDIFTVSTSSRCRLLTSSEC
jgi:hypothetical protein